MKTVFPSFFLLISLLFHPAQSHTPQWAKHLGSDWASFQGIVCSGVADAWYGSSTIAGTFRNTVDFDPGGGVTSLSSTLLGDMYFARYDSNGALSWAKQIACFTNGNLQAITSDASANIFITGSFADSADFDPGAAVHMMYSNGSEDIFLAMYDPSGNYLWAISIGADQLDRGLSLATDDAGNVLLAGYFRDTVDFDPGAGTNIQAISGGNAFARNLFIASFSNSGLLNWVNVIPSTNDFIDINSNVGGNVYATGLFTGTIDFDPGAGTTNVTGTGTQNMFIAAYDAAGGLIYAESVANASSIYGLNRGGKSIDVDGAGNVFLTGNFSISADFDPSASTAMLTASFSSAVFFARYDTAGVYQWAHMIDINGVQAHNICLRNNSFLLSGNYLTSGDFDPSASTATLTANMGGGWNMYLATYDLNGNYQSAVTFGNTLQDVSTGLITNALGDIFIAGEFQSDSMQFNQGTGVIKIYKTAATFQNIFFARFAPGTLNAGSPLKQNCSASTFPNPSAGEFEMDYSLTDGNDGLLEIYNLAGENILTRNLAAGSSHVRLQLDVANGIYLCKIISGAKISSVSFIVD